MRSVKPVRLSLAAVSLRQPRVMTPCLSKLSNVMTYWFDRRCFSFTAEQSRFSLTWTIGYVIHAGWVDMSNLKDESDYLKVSVESSSLLKENLRYGRCLRSCQLGQPTKWDRRATYATGKPVGKQHPYGFWTITFTIHFPAHGFGQHSSSPCIRCPLIPPSLSLNSNSILYISVITGPVSTPSFILPSTLLTKITPLVNLVGLDCISPPSWYPFTHLLLHTIARGTGKSPWQKRAKCAVPSVPMWEACMH